MNKGEVGGAKYEEEEEFECRLNLDVNGELKEEEQAKMLGSWWQKERKWRKKKAEMSAEFGGKRRVGVEGGSDVN